MFPAYVFLAMFLLQVVAGSWLFPARAIARVRGWARESGSERLQQLYPERDFSHAVARFIAVFRVAHVIVTLIGLALFLWFVQLTGEPAWQSRVKLPIVYFTLLQAAPVLACALYAAVKLKLLSEPLQAAKRSAVLERRRLADFVSPAAVWLAVLSWIGFVCFAIYLDLEVHGNATLSRQCLIALAAVTGTYALNGFVVYKYLYGKRNPLMSHEGRRHSIAMNLRAAVHTSTAVAWFVPLMGVLGQPHLAEWQPSALALFLAFTWVLSFFTVSAPSHARSTHAPGATP